MPILNSLARPWVVRRVSWLTLSLTTLFFLVAPPVAQAGCDGVKRVMGGTFTLETGAALECDLLVLGGSAVIEEGAVVPGSVVVNGGTVEVAGEIQGDVTVVMGEAILRETAEVDGELTAVFGTVTREAGASVGGGDMRLGWGRFLNWLPFGDLNARLTGVVSEALGFGLLALLVQLFLPNWLLNLRPILQTDLPRATVVGLGAFVVLAVVSVLLALSLCLIPLAFGGGVVLVVLAIYGWLGLGAWLGEVLAQRLKWHAVAPPVTAALGTALLTLASAGFREAVPNFSFLLGLLVLPGFGAACLALARAKTQRF